PLSIAVLRPPSCPTPFPYTPLFRSQGEVQCHLQAHFAGTRDEVVEIVEGAQIRVDGVVTTLGGADAVRGTGVPGFGGKGVVAALDRKSTRLNSSHVSISYAVFCLKK